MLAEKEQAWLFLREFTEEILIHTSNRSRRLSRLKHLRHLTKKTEEADWALTKDDINIQVNTSTSIRQNIYSGELNIGELNDLLKDKEIYAIECPGPGKFLIVKKPGKTDIIPMPLGEEEIKKIIEEFANASKTQPSEGVFISSYKDLEITAVLSDFAGSRFALTRYLNPAELIEESKMDLNVQPIFQHK